MSNELNEEVFTMWIEEPRKALTAGTLAVLLGGLLIAAGVGALSILLAI